MMKYVTSIASRVLIEVNLCILFLFLFYINKKELPPILLLVVLCACSIILFTVILGKFLNNGKWIYFATLFPLQLVVSNQAGLSIFMGMIVGLFIFWRGLSLYDDFSEPTETLLLLLSFITGLVAIIYSGISHYPYQAQIIFLLIIQILVVLISRFIRKWSSIDSNKFKFAIYFMKILTVVTVIGGMFALFLKYIQFVFLSVLQITALLLTSIIGPILNLIPYLQGSFKGEEGKPNLQESDSLSETENYQGQSYGLTQDILFILLILGVVALIIYLGYRSKLKRQTVSNNESRVAELFNRGFISNQASLLRKKEKPPEDLIRRQIFDFEKYAHKIKLGRLPFETLEEWWQRVGLIDSEQVIEIYDKIRYGGLTPSNEEVIQISGRIRHLKQKLKDIRKKMVVKNLED